MYGLIHYINSYGRYYLQLVSIWQFIISNGSSSNCQPNELYCIYSNRHYERLQRHSYGIGIGKSVTCNYRYCEPNGYMYRRVKHLNSWRRINV